MHTDRQTRRQLYGYRYRSAIDQELRIKLLSRRVIAIRTSSHEDIATTLALYRQQD